MLKLGSDADVHGDVIRGLRRRNPELDLVRVQEVGLRTADDPTILAWAASDGRVLLTQDRRTMVGHAYERVKTGAALPGVVALNARQGLGETIEDILLIAECYTEDDVRDQVIFLPL